MKLAILVCVLFFYSFLGWLYESTIFSLCEQGIFMNRGYFLGPYCPIYAVVIMSNVYLMTGINSTFKIFIVSMAVCTVVEYTTSYILEKLFDARYWNYYYFPMNINGRVSVPSSVFFGVAITIMVKWIHPATVNALKHLPRVSLDALAIGLASVFIFDAIITFVSMCNLNRKCKNIYESMDGYLEEKIDTLNEKKNELSKYTVVRVGKNVIVKAKGINQKFLELETRYLRRPGFYSTKYNEVIDKIRNVYRKNSSDEEE